MANEKVNHDITHIRLELARLHALKHVLVPHEHKLFHFPVVARQRDEPLRAGIRARRRRQVHVVDVENLAVDQLRPRVPVRQRHDARGLQPGRHDLMRQPRLLIRLGEDAAQWRVAGLDAAGDGAVQHARVGEERLAPAGHPDARDGARLGVAHVGRHVRAAGVNAKERGREALNPEVPDLGKVRVGLRRDAGDNEVLAVEAVEGGEVAALDRLVDSGLQRGVGERRGRCAEGDGGIRFVDDEG